MKRCRVQDCRLGNQFSRGTQSSIQIHHHSCGLPPNSKRAELLPASVVTTTGRDNLQSKDCATRSSERAPTKQLSTRDSKFNRALTVPSQVLRFLTWCSGDCSSSRKVAYTRASLVASDLVLHSHPAAGDLYLTCLTVCLCAGSKTSASKPAAKDEQSLPWQTKASPRRFPAVRLI